MKSKAVKRKTSMTARIDADLKEEFLKICKENGLTPAEALKDYIVYVTTTETYPLTKSLSIVTESTKKTEKQRN